MRAGDLLRARELQAAFAQRMDIGYAIEPAPGVSFEATLTTGSLGRLRLASMSCTDHTARRSPARRDSCYLVQQVVKGEVMVCQDGRESVVCAGDVFLINLAREFSVAGTLGQARLIRIKGDALRAVFPEVDCCTATAFERDDSATTIVTGMIEQMLDLAEGLDNAVQSRWGDAFLHVLAIALSAIRPIDGATVTDVVLLHKERIKTFARRHLSDPHLNCEMIAKHLRLSQRYIYDMFAQEPLTLMRWIRRERLERCKTELSSPRLQRRSISEIAFTWGFVDPAHFSRIFSAEFGVSPRAFRLNSVSASAH